MIFALLRIILPSYIKSTVVNERFRVNYVWLSTIRRRVAFYMQFLFVVFRGLFFRGHVLVVRSYANVFVSLFRFNEHVVYVTGLTNQRFRITFHRRSISCLISAYVFGRILSTWRIFPRYQSIGAGENVKYFPFNGSFYDTSG